MQVVVRTGKKDDPDFREVAFEYELGADFDAALELYGKEIMFGYYIAGAKVAVQNIPRQMLSTGSSNEEIVEFMKTWKLGEKRPRAARAPVDPVAAFMAALPGMDPKQVQAIMKELSGKFPPKK